jgi:hypothetical protein
MTRTGRFVAGVGAATLGVVAAVAFSLCVRALFGESPPYASTFDVLGLTTFGITAAAFYTWAVDGAFVFRRRRSQSASR